MGLVAAFGDADTHRCVPVEILSRVVETITKGIFQQDRFAPNLPRVGVEVERPGVEHHSPGDGRGQDNRQARIAGQKAGPARGAGGKDGSSRITGLRFPRAEGKPMMLVIGRQSIHGFFIGVLPGAGATLASFLNDAVERNIATGDDQAVVGHGSVKGLAAPAAHANGAKVWPMATDHRAGPLARVRVLDLTCARALPRLETPAAPVPRHQPGALHQSWCS